MYIIDSLPPFLLLVIVYVVPSSNEEKVKVMLDGFLPLFVESVGFKGAPTTFVYPVRVSENWVFVPFEDMVLIEKYSILPFSDSDGVYINVF